MTNSGYISIDMSDAEDSADEKPSTTVGRPAIASASSAATLNLDSSYDPDHETFVREQRAIYDSFQYHHQYVHVEPYRGLHKHTNKRLLPVKKPRFVPPPPPPPKTIATERSALLGGSRSTASITSTLSSTSTLNKDQLPVDVKNPPTRRRLTMRFCLYLLAYVLFLVLGSMMFSQLEGRNELLERQNFRDVRQRFLRAYANVIDDDLDEFIRQVANLNSHGISPLHNATAADMNWSFGQSLFFASTVITTIGYGHVTPLTAAGKAFCIAYACVGIPLTLVLLSAAVERALVPVGWLLGRMQARVGHLYPPFNVRVMHLLLIGKPVAPLAVAVVLWLARRTAASGGLVVNTSVNVLGLIAIFGAVFLALPTAIFAHLEPNWTTLDAFYYCFISLTTIGLGDYIPGDQPYQANRSLYKVASTVYLLVGLVAVMLCLTVFYDIPQLNLGQLFSEQSAAAAAAAAASCGDASEDNESTRLQMAGGRSPMCYSSGSGPSGLYIPQRDDEVRRSVVRIRPRGDESPSPDEEQPPFLPGHGGGRNGDEVQ